jgi:transcriptional regulator with XRE-family HTH domain
MLRGMTSTYELLRAAGSLRARIQLLMDQQKLTLSDLHRRTGIAKGYLSELLKDETQHEDAVRRKPSAETLYAIGNALGVSVADLLGHTRSDEEPSAWPPGLPEYVESDRVSPEDARVLARISLRGMTPSTADEWRHIHKTIQMYTTAAASSSGGR